MTFTYRELDIARSEFRLLRLRPAASMDAPLRISLFHASLDDAPEYEALSYVWGKTWGQFTIYVENNRTGDGDIDDLTKLSFLSITPSLDRALRYLRFRIRTDEDGSAMIPQDRVLWVDALCINQQDPVERSRQVQQMRRIYESCVSDIAWLGPDLSPPPTDKEIEGTNIKSDEDDGEDASSTPPPPNETEEQAEKRKQATIWSKKLAKAEQNRATSFRRRCQRLRDGLNLMRQVASRDVATLSLMVQRWNQEWSGSWHAQIDKDENGNPKPKPKDEYDPEDPDQKRYLTSAQVRSLYAAFSFAQLWSRVWVVQELSCAPRVLLAVGKRRPGEEQHDSDSSDTPETKATNEDDSLDMIDTLDWDKDIVGGFLDDTAYSDAFHSSWGHGTVGPTAANIFARVRAIQLQRRMLRSQRASGRRVALQSFEGVRGSALRWATIREQSTLEEEIWKTTEDKPESHDDKNRSIEVSENTPLRADPSLINVLARFKWTLATDPRDKVYGLLGLVSEAPVLPPVDYTLPTARVYADAALAIIETSGCLDLISQNPFHGDDGADDDDPLPDGGSDLENYDNRRAPDLPSWAPNFDRSLYTDYYDEFSTILFAQRGIYAAGKPDCKQLFPLDVQDGWTEASGDDTRRPVRSLRLRGTVLGRVAPLKQGVWEEHGRKYVNTESSVEIFRQIKAMYYGSEEEEEKMKAKVYAPTGEPFWDAFWRTVVGDCTAYPIRRLTAEERVQCSTELANLCRLREAEMRKKNEETRHFTTDEQWTEYRDSHRYDSFPPSAELLNDLPIEPMLRRMIRRWGVAQTIPDSSKPGGENGLMLMVRAAAQPGDLVAVLDGSKVPMILRGQDLTVVTKDGKKGDTAYFKYVCPAYVHGYMDGEAVTQAADGQLVEQDFVLV
ncbi:hypothetical protein SEUCBS139899_007909 [Sporothrix eucalyptigena]